MRFKLGLAIGLAAGYWVGSTPDEERRRQVDETIGKVRNDPRVQQFTDTVSRKAGKLTDAVDRRMTDNHTPVSGQAAGADTAATRSGAGVG